MAETCQTFDGWASEMNAREWIQNIRDTGGQLGVFEKYKIEEKPFAEGGFSKIYRATRDGYQFAMKIPNTVEISNGTVDIDRNTFASFREEMERWSLISNVLPDDVVCLLDYGYDPFPWMVMELADQSFEAAISSGSASIDDIRNVLTSLQNIHNIRMCHLDLKPDNILSVDGRWKLSDFGLSSFGQGKAGGSVRGTPEYMAPEQVDSRTSAKCDSRTDIWQMGVILYRLVTGRRPYPEGSYDSVVMAILSGGPDLSDVQEPYRTILRRALSGDPEARYRNARDMADALSSAAPLGATQSQVVRHSLEVDRALALYTGSDQWDFNEAYHLFCMDDSVLSKAFTIYMRYLGRGVTKDAIGAMMDAIDVLPELSQAAKTDTYAMWILGMFYYEGVGVDADYDFAFSNIKRSADLGNPLAMNTAGVMYLNGEGVPKDSKKAALYLTKGVKAGSAMAMRNLASEFINGNEFLGNDVEKAIDLYQQLSDKGDTFSLGFLGVSYCLGDHVPFDPEKGIRLLLRAYEGGYENEVYQVFDHDVIRSSDIRDGYPLRIAILKEGVREIDAGAFKESHNLEVVHLPSTLESIGGRAFEGTRVRYMEIPDGVTEIGKGAFQFCDNLEHVTFGSGLRIIGHSVFASAHLGDISLPLNIERIDNEAFIMSDIRSIEMPGVKIIGASAFQSCPMLRSVSCGSVQTIGDSAFFGCSSLRELSIDTVQTVSSYAFKECTGLSTVRLPNISSLGDAVFYDCTSLRELTLGPGLSSLNYGLVKNTQVGVLRVPSNIKVTVSYDSIGASIQFVDDLTSDTPPEPDVEVPDDAENGLSDVPGISLHERMTDILRKSGMTTQFIEAMELYLGASGRYDPVGAFSIFESQTDVFSQCMVSIMRYSGIGTYRDEDEAKMMIEASGAYQRLGEDPVSEWLMGRLIQFGLGFYPNPSLALAHYRKSAEEGFPPAEFQIGNCHQYGWGTDVSMSDALKWYSRASDHGLPQAQNFIAYMYMGGSGVEKSYEKAATYLRMAAESGFPISQYYLGLQYLDGKGVEESYNEGVSWLEKSAEQGYAPAVEKLGKSVDYLSMLRTPTDDTFRWMSEMAISDEKTSVPAFCLGTMYLLGIGCEKSEELGWRWIGISEKIDRNIPNDVKTFLSEGLDSAPTSYNRDIRPNKVDKKKEQKKRRWFGR